MFGVAKQTMLLRNADAINKRESASSRRCFRSCRRRFRSLICGLWIRERRVRLTRARLRGAVIADRDGILTIGHRRICASRIAHTHASTTRQLMVNARRGTYDRSSLGWPDGMASDRASGVRARRLERPRSSPNLCPRRNRNRLCILFLGGLEP
jgi:hypothetical protein